MSSSLGAPGEIHSILVTDVVKIFGATPALRGINVSFERGAIHLLKGPNGAGKSTLLNILGTQLKPTRGQVTYKTKTGSNLTRREVRAQLGWLSHTPHCYLAMSGLENLELQADLFGIARSAINPLLDRLHIGSFVHRPVSTLSRGQTQRIALARALIHNPSLLLLDEPWTGLDQRSSRRLEEVVRDEEAKGKLILIVSHREDLKEVLGGVESEIVAGRLKQEDSAAS